MVVNWDFPGTGYSVEVIRVAPNEPNGPRNVPPGFLLLPFLSDVYLEKSSSSDIYWLPLWTLAELLLSLNYPGFHLKQKVAGFPLNRN